MSATTLGPSGQAGPIVEADNVVDPMNADQRRGCRLWSSSSRATSQPASADRRGRGYVGWPHGAVSG
jgi:hypothetical protein